MYRFLQSQKSTTAQCRRGSIWVCRTLPFWLGKTLTRSASFPSWSRTVWTRLRTARSEPLCGPCPSPQTAPRRPRRRRGWSRAWRPRSRRPATAGTWAGTSRRRSPRGFSSWSAWTTRGSAPARSTALSCSQMRSTGTRPSWAGRLSARRSRISSRDTRRSICSKYPFAARIQFYI